MKNTDITEKEFYARIKAASKKEPVMFVRIENTIVNGIPDTIFVYQGTTTFVELKKLDKKLRAKLQDNQVSFFMAMVNLKVKLIILAFDEEDVYIKVIDSIDLIFLHEYKNKSYVQFEKSDAIRLNGVCHCYNSLLAALMWRVNNFV